MYDGPNISTYRLKLVTVVEMTEFCTQWKKIMPGSSAHPARVWNNHPYLDHCVWP